MPTGRVGRWRVVLSGGGYFDFNTTKMGEGMLMAMRDAILDLK
jgi:hypothetical protein